MNTLGEKLIAARKSQKMTQEQLAQRINVARTTISNWEHNRSHPAYDFLRALSDVLHFDFLGENHHSSGNQVPTGRKIRMILRDSPVIEVISPEDTCVFSDVSVNLQVNGSDSHGNTVNFCISANFCIENDNE